MEGVTLIRLIANNRSRREIGYRRWKFRTARISNEREDSRKSSVRDERWTRWKVSSSGKQSVGYINTCPKSVSRRRDRGADLILVETQRARWTRNENSTREILRRERRGRIRETGYDPRACSRFVNLSLGLRWKLSSCFPKFFLFFLMCLQRLAARVGAEDRIVWHDDP